MITNKLLQSDNPLNISTPLQIKDILFEKKNYSSEILEGIDISVRNIDIDFDKNNALISNFNLIMDDFQENSMKIKEETNEIFIKLLLCCTNYSSSSENEDIDTLLKQINKEIKEFDKELREIRSRKDVLLANVPSEHNGKSYRFSQNETGLIDEIDSFLQKYHGYNERF